METKEETKQMYVNLIKNGVNFYVTQGRDAGLGEKHFDRVLTGIIDKLIDAIFSADDEEAESGQHDLFSMIGFKTEAISKSRIKFLRDKFVKKNS